MTTVWFLIALIAFAGTPSINYKGFYAYHSLETCEEARPSLENFIVDRELRKGNTVFYVQTYCLEMDAFEDQLRKYQEENEKGISLGSKGLGA